MEKHEAVNIGEKVKQLAWEAGIAPGEIVDALVGIAWDEEEAGEVLEYLATS